MSGNTTLLHCTSGVLKLLDPPENSAELPAPLQQHPVGLCVEEDVEQAG